MEVLDKINVLAVVVLAVVVVVVGSTMSHRENINRNQINLVLKILFFNLIHL